MNKLTSIAAAAILLAAPMSAVASSSSAASRDNTKPGSSSLLPAAAADALATQTAAQGATPAVARTVAATTGPVIGLSGRGFGHGRGMSQWGARGAASQGRTAAQILEFYYPGTTSSDIGNPLVRVRITAMGSGPTIVAAETGLTLTDGSCTAALSPSSAVSWRVSKTSTGWKVEGNSSGSTSWWQPATTCAGFAKAQELTFVGDGSLASSVLTLRTPSGNRAYRGGLRANASGTVNVLPMDSYLRSVVPAEMPASWGIEAVKAQAVAARSYTAARLGSTGGSDICDTTACQVYPGLTSSNPEHPNSDAAVAATSGQVRKYGTAIAHTEFSSSNGGQTVASSLPYQVAKADPYDGVYADAPDTWNYLTMPVSAIEKAWSRIGTFRSMKITRDGKGAWFGGRATQVELTGTSGSQSVSGDTFRATLNLRSTWFIPVGSSVGTDFAGNGFSDVIARDASGNLWNYPLDGRGGWLPRTLVTTSFPAVPEMLAPGDFSGDGIPDLLSRTSAGALNLHRGSGAGTITSTQAVGSGWQVFNTVIAPGDLDGDGAIDILARDSAGVLWRYPTTGTGRWKARVKLSGNWANLRELEAVGDFDGDGGTDLVGIHKSGALYLLRFAANGTYIGPKAIGAGWQNYSGLTGAGDVDGDGNIDLLARYRTGALLAYRGDGRGGFLPRFTIGGGWLPMTFGS